MNLAYLKFQRSGKMGGWRRLFVAGTLLLAGAACAWAWHVQMPEMDTVEVVEFALSLWSIGAAALGILLIALAALDRGCVWVGNGFGLSPLVTRTGTAAVLAGLTLLGAVAMLTRYETVMPEGGSLRTGELVHCSGPLDGRSQALHQRGRGQALSLPPRAAARRGARPWRGHLAPDCRYRRRTHGDREMAAEHDQPNLTRAQQEALMKLLSTAFVLLRSPGYQYFWEKQEDWNDLAKVQAAVERSIAFGEALHNLPLYIFRSNFDFKFHKRMLESYLDDVPDFMGLINDLEDIEKMGSP